MLVYIKHLRKDPEDTVRVRDYDHKAGTIQGLVCAVSGTCSEFKVPPVGQIQDVSALVKKYL